MPSVATDRIPLRSATTASTADRALTRRRTPVASLALALWPWSVTPSASAQTNLAAAGSFMRQVGEELGTIVGSDTSRAQKQQQLQSLIDRTVAVDAIARFCLGGFRREASPSQQRAYLKLFHSVLVREVVVRLGDYAQEDVDVIVGTSSGSKLPSRSRGVSIRTLAFEAWGAASGRPNVGLGVVRQFGSVGSVRPRRAVPPRPGCARLRRVP
jgi:hypothetical protein